MDRLKNYLICNEEIVVGYSGGKDSSALLKLVINTIKKFNLSNKVTVIYCDTGVDIPVVNHYVHKTLKKLKLELDGSVYFDFKIAKPEIGESYFVKVLGRGYPPPTNKFRWCTRRLRTKPIEDIIKTYIGDGAILAIGVRDDESSARKKTNIKHKINGIEQKNVDSPSRKMLAPIVDWSLTEVWGFLSTPSYPYSIDGYELAQIYKNIGGECPTIQSPNASACSKGRFGCWTCTLIKKDKALIGLIDQGYTNLEPLLKWKEGLLNVRDIPENRWARRRNFSKGLGPLSISARKSLFNSLLIAQEESGLSLISEEEVRLISDLWSDDIIRDEREMLK